MNKPSVIADGLSNKKIIQANLCNELPLLNEKLLKLFIQDYKGAKWIKHRLMWRFLGYEKYQRWSFVLKGLKNNPYQFLKNRKAMQKRIAQYKESQQFRISSVFSEQDITKLAALMKESYSGFIWQEHDVLLVDNIQVAHAGMPGICTTKYPREIRAMLSNPIKIDYSPDALGIQKRESLGSETLGELFTALGESV